MGRGGVIAVNCRRKVKYPLFRGGGGGGGGGWRLWLCYWPFGQSISHVCCVLRNTTNYMLSELQVKSLWHRIKVAMGLKKCCRVVSSFPAEFADCVAELSFR